MIMHDHDSDTLPRVYISIASNIEPETNITAAIDMLRQRCNVLAISSVYESPPFGYTNQPNFWDVVVKCSTPLLPPVFKEMLDKIERALGRDRSNQESKYGPLTVDMDILLWGDTAFSYGTKPWRVPDDSILKQPSLALPLAEVAPDYVHPEEKITLKAIADRMDASNIKVLDVKIE